MVAHAVYLKANERVSAIQKEAHTRTKNGKAMCYILFDRSGRIAMLTQKLPAVTQFINNHLVHPEEPYAKVNCVGLWEMLNKTDGRVGGWHKGRWRVTTCDLESATAVFDAARRDHQEAAVIGNTTCYEVCV
jgi:hypothetical protein